LFLSGERVNSFTRVGMRTPERCRTTHCGECDREAVASPRSRKTTRGEADSRPPPKGPLRGGTTLSVVLGTLSVPQK